VKRWWLVVILIILVFTCGCSAADPRHQAQRNISLTIENDRFSPQKWTIPSGETIQLSIHNPEGDPHYIVVLKGQALGETDPTLLDNQYWSVSVLQNLAEASFVAPSMPGEYRIVCSLDGHEVKGEQGILVVIIP
jgi:plastocyanin